MPADNRDALDVLQEAGHYWIVNWQMVQICNGLDEAIILGYLCSMQRYWADHNQLKGGKWFFCTKDDMRKYTTLEARRQKKAVDNLVSLGLIETVNKGTPPTRHFHVNAGMVRKLLIEDVGG